MNMASIKQHVSELILLAIGLSAIKQHVPIGDNNIGLKNNLTFLGLSLLYVVILIITTSFVVDEWKSKSISFKFSPIVITISLVLLYFILINIERFKS